MTCSRKYYPNLSVVTRVYPRHTEPNGTEVVRKVWRTDSNPTERDGHVDYKQFYSPEGRRSFRTVHNDALGFQHRAQPLRHFGPRGRFQDGIDGGSTYGKFGQGGWKGKGWTEGRRGGSSLGAGGAERGREKGGGGIAWFRMTIPHGKKYDKKWLITTLQDHSTVPFRPLLFSIDGHSVYFYLDDAAAASALRKLSRRITDSEGYKVVVIMTPCVKPPLHQNNLKQEDLERIKRCMSKRFNGSQCCLDLSSIGTDHDLVSHKIEVKLNQKSFMQAMLRIIEENVRELLCLNLSNNKLFRLTDLADLVKKTPRLRALNLSHNELKSEQELDNLKGLGLVELCLDRNPLCDNFEDQTTYIRAVRKRFPSLLKLDGHVLPPPICFGVDTGTAVPPCRGSFFVSDEIRGIIQPFLQQYFSVYDSGQRQQLLDAYHDGACFSLSLSLGTDVSRYLLREYLKDNRNMKQVNDSYTRFRLLKKSRLNVVAFINELPKTQHDIASFTIDVNTYTSTLLAFTVNGVFKEVDGRSNDLIRAFTRVFIAVPAPNSGLCVVNDALYLRTATSEEKNRALATLAPSGTVSALSAFQQQMLSAFSQSSQMNLEWSQKCLQDNAWDFHRAAQIFTELKEQGKIPEVAFIK
ncbi:nuclear RNA export factor 1 [Triplophysa dalaica]|uniref:nuclear RNA export factor 1 n=1 Tax=Triplophysa dalaica TaxID=1582913 RepID=UPI0024DFB966|nr:nuclear RNA export factor 1 [Triplophysa dalaica]